MNPLSVPGIVDERMYNIGGMLIYWNTTVVGESV
jgi:hypothetical protein